MSATETKGVNWLRDPLMSRGLATTQEERAGLGIRGFLPAAVRTFEDQEACCMAQLRKKATPMEKYSFLQQLQNLDERLYYACLCKHTTECMPLVYTPTVGAACQNWSELYNGAPRGLYLSLEDAGSLGEILAAWPNRASVKAIVFTDGERILGLGDLGSNGMGIPIGKLALYTACAGIHPRACLPVTLDAGTNNQKLLDDPMYVGLRRRRERGPAYDALVEEFVVGAQQAFGENVLLQFEDFGNSNAFRLLDRYQPRACTFNDDIQGTASVVLAGLVASGRLSGRSLADETFLFLGAGEAGVGIADLIALAISKEAPRGSKLENDLDACRKNIWLVDSQGLVTADRDTGKLAHHKLPYAHAKPPTPPPAAGAAGGGAAAGAGGAGGGGGVLLEAVEVLKPTCLIGVSAVPNTFTQQVVEALCKHTQKKPVVMALSNPTSQAECTARQAYEWSNGECVFASGSPFDPVTLNVTTTRQGQGQEEEEERTFVPGQGNNSYVFPAIGLAATAVQARRLTDDDMYVAAKALASLVTEESLATGCVYPPLSTIRAVSASVAAAVAANIYARGDATLQPQPKDLRAHCEAHMYDPSSSSSSSFSSSKSKSGSGGTEEVEDGAAVKRSRL